jgi:hypothetical protein
MGRKMSPMSCRNSTSDPMRWWKDIHEPISSSTVYTWWKKYTPKSLLRRPLGVHTNVTSSKA